jgi:hypothetical protein
MKLSKEALVEIVAILQYGILRGEDVSEKLRELDFAIEDGAVSQLVLSVSYLQTHPRGGALQGPEQEN